MGFFIGRIAFVVAPIALGLLLLWRFPPCRRVRLRSLVGYLVVVGLMIWGALLFVGHVAMARVPPFEVVVILWFAIGWRLAWEIWSRSVNRLGRRWVRWARWRRRQGHRPPLRIRLIHVGRGLLTLFIFLPAFLSCVITHRAKLTDGQDPMSVYNIPFEPVRIETSDGLTLDAWFVPERGADKTIIICHGAGANKGNFVTFLGPLSYHGYNVVFFDFRAHGSSGGRTTTYGIRERLDVLAVVITPSSKY